MPILRVTTEVIEEDSFKDADLLSFRSGFLAAKKGREAKFLVVRDVGWGDVLLVATAMHSLYNYYEGISLYLATNVAYRNVIGRLSWIAGTLDVKEVSNSQIPFDLVLDLREKFDYLPICREVHRLDLIHTLMHVPTLHKVFKLKAIDSDKQIAADIIKDRGGLLPNRFTIGVHYSSYAEIRSWDWAEDFVQLSFKMGYNVITLQDRSTVEWNPCGNAKKAAGIIRTHGNSGGVEGLLGLLSYCDVVVCPDSGVMHTCGMMGIPFVALFGSIPPELRDSYYSPKRSIFLKHLPCVPCFLPSQEIITERGFQTISKLHVFDKVLTHQFRFRSVNEIKTRHYEGQILRFGFKKLPFPTLSVTPEHPILTYTENSLQFKPAGELKKGAQVAISYPAEEEHTSELYLQDFVGVATNLESNSYYVWQKTSTMFCNHQRVLRCLSHILLDEDFYRFVGYYLAEGWTGKKTLAFVFGVQERFYIEDVIELSQRVFGLSVVVCDSNHDKSTRITISCQPLAYFFKNLFGTGFDTKLIPDFMMKGPISLQRELLKGLFRGDGFLLRDATKKRDRINGFGVCLTNKKLIFQVWLILLRCGYVGSINFQNAGAWKILCRGQGMDFLNEIFPTLEYPLQEGTRECFKKQGKFYLFKLNRIESESYCGEVFNLCVDEDETYSAGGVVVHNCFDWQVSCCNNKPTYKACLTEITPEAVMVQVEALLKETKFSKQSEKPC